MKPQKKSKKKLIIPLIIIGLIASALAFANIWYFSNISGSTYAGEPRSLVINPNDSIDTIARRLEEQGMIKSALAFKIFLKLNNKANSIKSGEYHGLAQGFFPAEEIAEILTRGASKQTFRITIYPGDTLYKIKQRLIAAGFTAEAVDKAFNKDYDLDILKIKPAGASLEGFLFGETYEFYSDASAEDVVKRAIEEFGRIAEANNLKEAYKKHNLTLYEGLILASIIEKESYKPDMPQVAQVFQLRLEKGIPLGSDATIAFAADLLNPNRDKTDMSILSIDSPFNTRKHAGLVPTPIASPGIEALMSVANPAPGDYLFFLTGDSGMMYYAHTDSEHNRNIQLYCKERCKLI
jgi:UPF0755 protein